jgi:MFS family permease
MMVGANTNLYFSQGAWFVGNCVANIIGGVVAYGIGHSSSDLQSWRLLFLALGAITSGYAVFLFFVLPDSPATASFLTPTERTIAVQRTLANKTGATDSTIFQWSQVMDAAKDPQAWLLVFYTFCVNLANGGLTSVGGTHRKCRYQRD